MKKFCYAPEEKNEVIESETSKVLEWKLFKSWDFWSFWDD